MPHQSTEPLPPIRSKIALLVMAGALPAALGFGALVWHYYQSERGHVINEAAQAARVVGVALERDLGAGEMAAQALASSPYLRQGDMAALRRQAIDLLHPSFPGMLITLSDSSGRQLMSTDTASAPGLGQADLRPIFSAGKTRIASLHLPAMSRAPLLALEVPVFQNQQVRYALTVLYPADRLDQILREQQLSSYFVASIIDADGITVARTRAPQTYVGQPAAAAIRAQLQGQPGGGVLQHDTLEGVPAYSGFRRSQDGRWSVTTAIRVSTVFDSLLESVALIAGLVALMLLAGFAFAGHIGGQLGASIQRLTQVVNAVARGEPFRIGKLHSREAAEVAAALVTLDADLRRHRTELEALVAARTLELEKTNAQLETLYATAPVGLIFVDTELHIVKINDYLAEINGSPVEAHLGRYFGDMIGDATVRGKAESAYRTVLLTGKPIIGAELRGPSPDPGQPGKFWVVSYYPVYGNDGGMSGITALLLDITELKRTEAESRHSRHLLRSIVENIPAMVFLKRASDLRFEMFNRHGELTLGRSRDELLGKNDYDFFTRRQADAFTATDRQLLASGQMVEIDQEAITAAGGKTRYFTTRKVVLRDDAGLPTHVLGVSIDITERRRASEVLRATTLRLEQSERFIRTVTDNLPGMVSYWDAGLRCRFANKFYNEWFGKTSEELDGIHLRDLLGKELFAVYTPHVDGVLAGRPQSFERDLLAPDGRVRHSWVNYIPDLDEHEQVRGFFVLASDVSELKRSELRLHDLNEQLMGARDKAEAASIAKSEFVANMSHEIRTPMNAIIGLARLLEESPLERRERSYVGKIQLATQSLLGVVNDILDFSKIEAGQLKLEQRRFTLDTLLGNISILLASSAWVKGVEPIFEIAPDLPSELVGDALRLEQILVNLLANAIKFTARGEVVLAIRKAAEDGGGIRLEFSVRDTGIGISAEQQAHIFDAFSQGDSGTSRKYGGTGLGLAICRRIVGLMGGDISVDSTPGQGSVFRFTCGFGKVDGAPASPLLHNLALLIVDDNRTVRTQLQAICQSLGWRSWCADSGDTGLDLLRQLSADQQHIDVLLLDSAMPGMDGVAMLTQARAATAQALPPVIMLVADHASENLEHIADSLDIAAILSKPTTPQRLLAAVMAVRTGSTPPPALPVSTPLSGLLAGMRLLLVEDNEINQEVASYILLHAGARVTVAVDGQIALDLLRATPDQFDAVLMDLQMPVMNGYEATSAIRAMGLSDLPIVAMTANAMEEDRSRAISSGMNAHVAKPIDVDDLIGTLRRLAPARPAGLPLPAADQPLQNRSEIPRSVPGIDLEAALHRFGGDYGVFIGLLKRFENSQGDAVAQTRGLLASGKRHHAAQLLHRVCGVAANLGASQVASLSAQAERAVKEGRNSDLAPLLQRLDEAMGLVIAAARTLPLATPAPPAASTSTSGDLPQALEQLLIQIRNNNLKALASFQSLRPALERRDRETALAMADAIETLNFSDAEQLVLDILKRKGSV